MNALERARKAPRNPRGRPTKMDDGQPELAVAWLFGELTHTQAAAGFDCAATSSNVYSRLCRGLREAVRRGLIRKAAPRKEAA